MKDTVLSSTKAKLIDLMKCDGEISVDEGAEQLGLASTTIRQHLAKLHQQGFVKTRNKRYGRGRPLKMYSLTQKSDIWYENTESELLIGLLEFLEDRGARDLIEDYFEEVARDNLRDYQAFASSKSGDTLSLVCQFMESRGFVPECQGEDEGEDDTVRLSFCHCPFRSAVETSGFPCRIEERFLEAVLGAKLVRDKHIASGDDVCEYHVVREPTAE